MGRRLCFVLVVLLVATGAMNLTAADVKKEAAKKPVVLWGLQYDPHVEAYQRLAELYRKKIGGEITVQPQAWPLETKVVAALAAGDAPDVVCMMGWVKVPLVKADALIEVSKEVFKAVGVSPQKDFIGDAIGAYTYQGGIYGVPVESCGVGFHVNVPTDELKTLGIYNKYPPGNGKLYFDSYEQLWDLAKILQKKDDKGVVTRWGLNSTGWEMASFLGILNTLLDQKTPGMRWWDPKNHKFNIDNPQFQEAVRLYITEPIFTRKIETFSTLNNSDALLQGQAALGRGNGTPAVSGPQYGYKFEMVLAPKINGKLPIFAGEGGWGFVGLKSAKNRAGAIAFLQLVASKEGQLEFAKIYGGLQNIAWKGLVNDTSRFADQSKSNPLLAAAKVSAEALSRTEYYGDDFGYPSEVNDIFSTNLALVREGSASPQAAAKTIQKALEDQYARYLEE